ncbi:MAG: ATP-dependent DNA helicase RecG [Oscillospiraceae bacterium]|nr:ATP-dependent DNA helicase RecG [Oscillospiraceae bacterium]
MPDMTTNVRYVRGIGEQRAKSLQKLGITNLRELISYFPRAYEDRREYRRIADLVPGENACVRAMVATEPKLSHIRKGLDLVKLRVVDESAALELTYFNQSYLKNSFHLGEEYVFYGKAEGNPPRRQMVNPLFEPEGANRVTGRIVPIYPLTAGVSQNVLSSAVRQGLDACADDLTDFLPEDVRKSCQLCHVRYAYENVHFPADEEALAVARRRLAFEELYLLTLGLRLLRDRRGAVTGQKCAPTDLAPFYDALPFSLTGAQKRAIGDAVRDMCADRPMNRLVQGDVGSGKTMVAAAAIWFAAQNGMQSALMAPTEILAEQHYKTIAPLLEGFGVRCALLTAATTAKTRRSVLEQLSSGEITLAIGTHALLSADVTYQRLGLVVTDEQHRFGVDQRAALGAKGDNPHLLVMSATPIPRTLALMIYGDLDVSLIDELPPGRQSIDTYAVNSGYHKRIYDFLRKLIAEGRQAYIICPMVAENDELPDERKAVTVYAEALQKDVFPDLTVTPIHGKMKPKEKDAVMRAFAAGEIDILVSTTVVEVGVDVPNAAVMLIENAECFGLSQLHQLRGRVGRGSHKSYCILVSDNTGEDNRQRLAVMTKTNNGFAIAEEDLKLRGPGDFFGSRQHGLPSLRVADLTCDMELLHLSRAAAERLIADDPDLAAHPALRGRIDELFELHATAMN